MNYQTTSHNHDCEKQKHVHFLKDFTEEEDGTSINSRWLLSLTALSILNTPNRINRITGKSPGSSTFPGSFRGV